MNYLSLFFLPLLIESLSSVSELANMITTLPELGASKTVSAKAKPLLFEPIGAKTVKVFEK